MGDSLFYKPSGRLSGRQVDGAAMSYTYDMYGRLTFCDASMVAEPGSDYSTSYTYDANSNITSLRRAGAIDRVGNTIETGYHSEAEFELEGNRISWGTLWSVANTFEGATGILQDDAEVYHEYDPQGRLTASNTDQIAEIEYNHLSQPVRVKFFDGKEQFSVYDNAGQLIKRYTNPGGGRAERIDQVFIGPYEFGANWTLKKIHFAGGYFTPDGKVHYHITDYQGSVGAVIRGDGVVEQRTHYYPYGEPWLEPEGDNRRLHTGKERLLWGSTPIHDFGARILPPAIPFWTTPDPCSEKYYHLGPYTFCAADPINHTDPNGCEFTPEAQIAVDRYMAQIKKKMDKYETKNKPIPQELTNAYNDLNALIESDQLFDIVDFTNEERWANSPRPTEIVLSSTYAFGYTTYNLETDAVTFHIDGGVKGTISAIAHEFKHGNQFLEGKLDLAVENCAGSITRLYDLNDEFEAFNRGNLFTSSPTRINEITKLYPKLETLDKNIGNIIGNQSNIAPNSPLERALIKLSNSNKTVFRANGKTFKPVL